MRSKFFFLAFSLGIFILGKAQPAIQWEKTHGGSFDDNAFCMTITADEKSCVIAGNSISADGDITNPLGSDDIWLVKINLNSGSVIWQKSLGGTNAETPYGIHQLSDGGYILAGKTASSNGDVSGNHGIDDFWVVRLDSGAGITWQKCYGGTNIEIASEIKETADGGFIVCGNTASNDGDVLFNHGTTADIWVLKLDAGGNIQWQKSLGGTSAESSTRVIQTSDGGYAICGMTLSSNGDVSGNHGGMDGWVVKLDAQGNLSWQKSLGGTGSEQFSEIQELPSGDLILTGYTSSSDGDVSVNQGGIDLWLVDLSSSGTLVWEKTFGGTQDDYGYRIALQGNNLAICGWTASADGDVTFNHGGDDYWVLLTDFSGNLTWQKTYGGSQDEDAHFILALPGGQLIVTGFTRSQDGDVSFCHSSFKDYWTLLLFDLTTGIENADVESPGWNFSVCDKSICLNNLDPGTVYTVVIYDEAGRRLETQEISGPGAVISIHNSFRGICFAEVNDGKKRQAFRFVKTW